MIWFKCKKCGKALGRAESSVGAMVFCECGEGVRVPWESTTAPPPSPPPSAQSARPVEPIRFESPAEPMPAMPSIRRERRTRDMPLDPNACFNHSASDKAGVCDDCKLSFCSRCLTPFRGHTYCAACKNYRTRLLQRRPEGSKLAIVSLLFAVAAGPLMFLMISMAASRHVPALLLLALLLPALAVTTGVLSLHWIRGNPRRGGQQLAISAIALAVVVGATTAFLFFFADKLTA